MTYTNLISFTLLHLEPGWMGKGTIPVRGKHLDELSAVSIFIFLFSP